MGNETTGQRLETLAARALGRIDEATHGVVPAIHVTTTFVRDADNRYRSGFSYGRPDNLTVRHAEDVVLALEGGRAALAFASGMAAATTLFSALKPGRHVVAPKVMYWALRNWLAHDLTRHGTAVDFVDMSDCDSVRAAIRPGKTSLIWAETPANPLWSITDLSAVADMAHAAGAILAVDSTAATPVLTRPLELGADIVMHSATKYLNGHSDAIAGMLVTAKEDALWAEIARLRAACGAILGPFEAALLTRGMRTLHLRVRAAAANAMALALHFADHPHVTEVLYPGLASHPQHALAARQMQGGFGGMLSIRVAGGAKAAIATAAEVKVWSRATSLGGVESLIEHRASVEGPDSPVPDDLLRLSAGIEHVDDLIGDLDRALALAHR
jgi:cystathionine gamma-synthase